MKLEKREITLNEKDSLQDMFFMEQILLNSYEEGLKQAKRKELHLEMRSRIEDIKREMQGIKKQLQTE